jgi:porin
MLYPLPGKYHDTDITGALIMQYLFDGRAALFGGKLHAVDLVTALFPHVGYGQESFWNVSSLVSALPWFRFINLSMWGGGGWTIKDGQIQGGGFAYGQKNVSTDTSTTSESFSDGVGFAAFWRFFYKIGDKPGSVLLFAGGATKDYPSLERTSWGFIPGEGLVDDKSKKPWDVAAYLQQVFWQAENDDKRYAQLFMGGTWGNDDPNFSHWNIFANIEAFGPMARRPNDRMGIAGYFNGITTDLKHLTSTVGIGVRDLWGFEAYYNFEITPWMHLTGDIQLIENGRGHDDIRFIENGSRGDSIAVVPGVRLVIDF